MIKNESVSECKVRDHKKEIDVGTTDKRAIKKFMAKVIKKRNPAANKSNCMNPTNFGGDRFCMLGNIIQFLYVNNNFNLT